MLEASNPVTFSIEEDFLHLSLTPFSLSLSYRRLLCPIALLGDSKVLGFRKMKFESLKENPKGSSIVLGK